MIQSPTGPEQQELPKALFVTKTLSELGGTLPIGIQTGGQGTYARDIVVKPFRVKEEKLIGTFRANARSLTSGKLVANLLATVCSKIGPYDFETIERESERMLCVSNMYMMDVLYAYLYTRVATLGGKIKVAQECPNCRFGFEPIVDLGDMDVKVLADDQPKDLTWTHTLTDGLVYNEKLCKTITVGLPTWASMDNPNLAGQGAMNIANREVDVLRHSIVAIDGERVIALNPDALDELTLRDKNGLLAAISDFTPGPELVVAYDCPRCAHHWMDMIEWTYDVFFKGSSQ